MPDLRIIINLDNDAFADGAMTEAGRILRTLAQQLEDGWQSPIELMDANGNTCGRATITTDKPDTTPAAPLALHAVNVLDPLTEDRRAKVRVRMVLVLATSAEEAVRLVRESDQRYETNRGATYLYRNVFTEEDGCIVWDYQSWDREKHPDFAKVEAARKARK